MEGSPSVGRAPASPSGVSRNAGSGLEQIGALELRCLGQRRLEQLPHRLRKRSRSPLRIRAGPVVRASALCCGRSSGREQRRLANPRRPFDHHQPAAPRCERRRAPTRFAPSHRSARAALRWPRPLSLIPQAYSGPLYRQSTGVSTVRIAVPAFDDRAIRFRARSRAHSQGDSPSKDYSHVLLASRRAHRRARGRRPRGADHCQGGGHHRRERQHFFGRHRRPGGRHDHARRRGAGSSP